MRVLATVDVHDRPGAVLATAVAFARHWGGKVDAGFASEWAPPPRPFGLDLTPEQHRLWKSWNDELAVERDLLEQVGHAIPEDVRGETHLWPGAPLQVLPDHAADYDLLVVATHGRTGLDRVLLGSVAAGLLRRSPTPVLVAGVGDPVTNPAEPLRILAPVERDEAGALPWIASHLKGHDLELVHVQHPLTWAPGAVEGESVGHWPALDPQGTEHATRTAMLEDAVAHGFPEARAHVIARTRSHTGDDIASHAEASKIDLIVMPTHARAMLGQLFLGSVAQRVAERAGCPVIVVPQEALPG